MNIAVHFLAFGLWTAMLVLVVCLVWKKRSPETEQHAQFWFFFLLAFALICFRWPYLSANVELNVDESQMLAQGMKYLSDFLPWRSVDGTTSGPLDTYVVMWPVLFGLPMNYCTSRIMGVMLIFLTVLFSQRMLRQVLDPAWSLVLTFPLATMYLFAWGENSVHFSSEHLPVLLIAISSWLGLKTIRNPSLAQAASFGLIAGAVPFAKPQAAPIAILLSASVFAAWILLSRRQPGRRPGAFRLIVAATAGALVIPTLILVPVALLGAWNDFVIRFLVSNLTYRAAVTTTVFNSLFLMFSTAPTITAYFEGVVLVILVMLFAVHRSPQSSIPAYWLRETAMALAAILAVTVMAILRSGLNFGHYLHNAILPFFFLAAFFCVWANARLRPPTTRQTRGLRLQALSLGVFPLILAYVIEGFPLAGNLASLSTPPSNPTVKYLEFRQRPGDRLTVWGWSPSLYVLSGLTPATRDTIGQRMLMEDQLSQYYKESFLKELQREQPRFFIDAAALFGWSDWPPVERLAAETNPAVRAYLESAYCQETIHWETASGMKAIRIYERKAPADTNSQK